MRLHLVPLFLFVLTLGPKASFQVTKQEIRDAFERHFMNDVPFEDNVQKAREHVKTTFCQFKEVITNSEKEIDNFLEIFVAILRRADNSVKLIPEEVKLYLEAVFDTEIRDDLRVGDDHYTFKDKLSYLRDVIARPSKRISFPKMVDIPSELAILFDGETKRKFVDIVKDIAQNYQSGPYFESWRYGEMCSFMGQAYLLALGDVLIKEPLRKSKTCTCLTFCTKYVLLPGGALAFVAFLGTLGYNKYEHGQFWPFWPNVTTLPLNSSTPFVNSTTTLEPDVPVWSNTQVAEMVLAIMIALTIGLAAIYFGKTYFADSSDSDSDLSVLPRNTSHNLFSCSGVQNVQRIASTSPQVAPPPKVKSNKTELASTEATSPTVIHSTPVGSNRKSNRKSKSWRPSSIGGTTSPTSPPVGSVKSSPKTKRTSSKI